MTGHIYIKGSLVNDKGTWTVRARAPDPKTGKRKLLSKSTGLKVKDNTKRKAEAKMREIVEDWEKQYNEGTLFIANSITFGEYIKQWLKGRKLYINPNTLKSYEVVAEAPIIPLLGDVKLTALTRQHIQNYYESFADTLTVNTMKKHHVVIHGALESAVLDGIVKENVSDKVKLPKNTKFEANHIREQDLPRLFSELEKQDEPVRAGTILALIYGLRRSEICGLRWSDIDFDSKVMHIRNTVTIYGNDIYEAEHTKTKASRRDIVLVDSTIPYLLNLKNKNLSDKVCSFPDGKPVRPDTLTNKIMKFLKECGFENVRLHDLRHTAATVLARELTPKQVQAFLGHEDFQTTMNIYTHIETQDKINTSCTMDNIIKKAEFCSESCSES